jgi:LmbE family N-acetylglucosaminyl deacetylase
MDETRVLVVAAHPDDELLGCGGTVALHSQAGDRVTSVVVCEGESLRYGPEGVGMRSHMERAASRLGVEDVRLLGFPDQRLDTFSVTEVTRCLEEIVRHWQPRIVYCQHGGDANRDHQLVFQAALVATRPTEACVEVVYTFDTASSTEWGYPRSFAPDTWIDISTTLEAKLEAMACYQREVRDFPHPRSLQALRHRAHAWGAQACMEAAEVFMTVRRVIRHG